MSKLQETVEDREAWRAAVTESDTAEGLNNSKNMLTVFSHPNSYVHGSCCDE